MSNILVIGGTGGIGTAVIEAFSSNPNGNLIQFTSRNTGSVKSQDLSRYILHAGNCYKSISLNIPETIYYLKHQIDSGIDYFINCAGITKDHTLKNMSTQELDEVIDVNLKGAIRVTKEVIPFMKKGGCIINIGSVVGSFGNYGQTVYSASKAALIGFTKSLSYELASENIRVNCIIAGPTDTEMIKNIPEKYRQKFLERITMKRFGKPDEIAKFIKFICIDGTYCTGSVYEVSGGFY